MRTFSKVIIAVLGLAATLVGACSSSDPAQGAVGAAGASGAGAGGSGVGKAGFGPAEVLDSSLVFPERIAVAAGRVFVSQTGEAGLAAIPSTGGAKQLLGDAETDGLFLDPSGRLVFSQRPTSSSLSTNFLALDPKTLSMTPVLSSPGCGWATHLVGNGVELAARCGSIVTVWNGQTGQQVFRSMTPFTGGLAYFKNRLLATDTPAQGSGSIGVIDTVQKTTKTWLSGIDSPGAIAVFGDLVVVGELAGEGRLLAIAGDGEAGATQAIWATGTRVHTIVSHGSDVFWSDSGGAARPPGEAPLGEGRIFRRRGDGTVEVVASGLTYPTGIWVDDDAIYWVSWGRTKPFASLFRARRN